jgi:23S rRNA (pseudouridine1915-N3)-methyltransferase
MRLCLVSIGRLKAGPEQALIDRYLSRAESLAQQIGLAKPFLVLEHPASSAQDTVRRQQEEAAWLLAKSEDMVRVVLDERGTMLDSAAFAALLKTARARNASSLAFLLGGPEGHSQKVREKADTLLALSRLTLPHQLARLVLAEQIYRSLTLLTGHPYHRA